MNAQDQVTHPASKALKAFALGHLNDDDATDIADHLGICEPCLEAVLAVPDDSMLSLLRPAGSTPVPRPELLGATVDAFEDGVPPELRDHPRYQVRQRLGAGGMGVVYKARHRLMEKIVALKVISKQLSASPAVVERFRREVRIVARLSHPNLVQAHDAEQEGDLHFLVMEFVEGENLSLLVERHGPLPIETACDYVRQAAQGLAHALTLGLVHRDVKPQNLIVTPQGQVKVLDFGLASIGEERAGVDGLTEFGQGIGTPDYVAPEQVRDARSADTRADVYSLGCTLYYLLTGRPPFPEGNSAQKIAAHLEKQPAPLQQLRPQLPAALVQVIERMMDKERTRRYQTLGDVVAALEPFTLGEPRAQRRNARRPRWGWPMRVAVGAAAVLFVAGALTLALTSQRARPGGPEADSVIDNGPDSRAAMQKPRLLRFDVSHAKRVGGIAEEKGLFAIKRFSARLGDRAKVSVPLTRPAYGYLIAYAANGKEFLLDPLDEKKPPLQMNKLLSEPPGSDTEYDLNDGVGLHVFLAVVSSEPLPAYAEWKKKRGHAPWGKVPGRPEAVWRKVGGDLHAATAADPDVRGSRAEQLGIGPVRALVVWWQEQPGVELVGLTGFAVTKAK